MPDHPRGLAAGERAALFIGECQNRMTNPEMSGAPVAQEAGRRGIIPRIARLAEACRAAGVPVIFGRLAPRQDFQGFNANCALLHRMKKDGDFYEGSVFAEINPGLEVRPGDLISTRRQGITDFSGSELDALLRNMRVETLIMTGVSTNVGVYATCIGAVERGYTTVVVEDCTAGSPHSTHEFMIRNSFPLLATVTTCDAIVACLEERVSRP